MRQRNKEPRHRYVIVQPAQNQIPLSAVLRTHPEVAILDELDSSTALVEMSEQTRQQLTQEFPDLAVELNLQYKLLAR